MSSLQNSKHEQFANAVAKGVSAEKAYVSAGYSAQGAAASASRLLRDAKVRERINELKAAITEKIVEQTGLTKSWVTENLKEIVERSMQVRVVTKNGREVKTLLLSAKEGEAPHVVGVFTFAPRAATEALELIGKELGMFVNRVAGANGEPLAPAPVDYSQLSDEELQQARKLLSKAVKK